MSKIRTAVIGCGHLGRFHARKYAVLKHSSLQVVVDTIPERAGALASELGVEAATDYRDVLNDIEAVSIVVPAVHHHAIARRCLEADLHLLLEKPMTTTLEQADDLVALAAARQRVLQVGLLERFNPAVIALAEQLDRPLFIESNRLFPFNARGTDVSVVLDLMIHDIDLILDLVQADITRIDASGVQVLTDDIDIVNARIQFDNGCTANVTASRASLKQESKMRLFQADAYFSLDFYQRRLEIYRRGGSGDQTVLPGISREQREFESADLLMIEIAAFLDAVRQRTEPLVRGADGRRALQTAVEISRLVRDSARTR